MKKIVLLSLIALTLCAFPTNMRADDVCRTIGSATTKDGMAYRLCGSFSYQTIFTKDELIAAGVKPGNINGIKLTWDFSTNNDRNKELSIYMASTAKSFFTRSVNYVDNVPADSFTTTRGYYYDANTQSTGGNNSDVMADGENTYTFNSPFVWDGNSNIVIATIVNGEISSSTGFEPRGSYCGVNRSIREAGSMMKFNVGEFDPYDAKVFDFRPVISFCQDNMTCPNVTNVAASNVTINSASITWDAASCTDGYDVAYSTSPVTDFSTATIQHVTTNSINLTDLSDDTDYYVYVRARCTVFSDWSQALYFKTLFDCSAPENVTITDVQKHSVTLNWTNLPRIPSHDIIVSLAELADPSSAEVTYANVTGSSKVLGNIRCEITYHVYIRANCGTNGYSDWTHVSATTLPVRRYDCSRDADYVCGTGTDASDLVHPARPCSYTQEIYTADELHALGFAAGPIKAVEFDFQSFGYNENKHKMQSVYIGTTDKDTFAKSASEFVTGLTQVYGPVERTCPNNGGWLRYDFSTSFYWDGESNIVVCFRSDKCGDDEVHFGWLANGTLQKDSNNQSIYRTIIASDFNPIDTNRINSVNNIYRNYRRSNIRFVICYPDTDPCPTIRNAPDASSITHDAATITWSVISEEDIASYDIIASEEEITDFTNVQPTHPGIITTTTSCRLTSLNPETDYYVYVRVNCVNGDLSESSYQWSPVCHFRTDELCKTPYNLSVTNIAERTATLNWKLRDVSATAFDLVVSKEQLDPSTIASWQNITATNNAGVCTYTLIPLMPGTHYYVYIRTNCGDNVTSRLSTVEFNTKPIFDCSNIQSMVVADGTANDIHFPVYGLYCDHSQKTQSIYPASMLTGLLENKITKLKYFVSSGGSSESFSRNWENITFNIRMMTTDQSTLSGFIATTNATLVYSGTLRANVQNGMEITLGTPFKYTGGNLLIEFELPVAAGYASCAFYGKNTDGYVSCREDYSSSLSQSMFLPKVEFSICEKAPACPALGVAPVASDVAYNAATITWNAGAGEYASTYDIIVSESEIDDFETQYATSLRINDINGTSYGLTSLSPETHYYVYVRVNCNADGYADGSSLWSPACEFTTEPFCAAPENFAVADKTSASARLTWTKRGAAESWKIHVAQGNEITVTGNDCQITGKQVSYTLTGLTPNTNYNLRLQSIDESCTDDLYANDLSFRTLNTVTDIISFEITNATVAVDIDAANHTISATTRYGTDLSNLAFTLELADNNGIAKVGDNTFTGPWDFTSPVTILVYAEDRDITPQQWTITIVNETCATPYDISVTNVDEHNAMLNWNVTDVNPTTFDLVVSDVPLTDPSTSDVRNITVTNNGGACNYALGYLVPGRHYYVYIRTNCGNENSHWSFFEFSTMSVFDCSSTQTVVVAEGTVGNEKFPVYGYFCDLSQKTQSIYPSSMLAGLMGNKITKLKYFVQDGGSSDWENATFNIRMMTTTKSTLSDSVSTANATPVYSGTLRANTTDGMEITLTTPFEYSGGNLLIEFELPVADGWSECYFYGTEADGDVSYMNYGTYAPTQSTFLPKIEFTVCGKVSACPEVTDIAAANIDETSATIIWTASAGMDDNTSDIYYSTTEVEDFTSVEPQHIGITGTSQQIAGLNPYTTYYVYVRTHCDAQGYDDGVSGWAGTSFLTLAQCRVPGDLKATVTGKHTATITWTNTSGNAQQANNFTYILSTTPVAEAALETTATAATGVTTTSVNLTNLLSNTTYYFYIKNVCSGIDCSSPWVSCQFTTPIAMPAVINLQAHDIAHNAFTATWQSDIANFADETEWEVACVAHGESPTAWTTVTMSEYFALRLTPETHYDFYVRAKNGNNHSANAMIEVTTIGECQIIGESTEVDPDYSPIGSMFGFERHIYLFTQDDGLDGDRIRSISWQYQTGNTTVPVKIYLKNTTLTDLTSLCNGSFNAAIDGATLVYDGSVTLSDGWIDIDIDEFEYAGGNIMVFVASNYGGYGSLCEQKACITNGVQPNTHIGFSKDYSIPDDDPMSSFGMYRLNNRRHNIKFCFDWGSCSSVGKLKVDDITTTTARAHWYPGDTETAWHVYNSTTELTNDGLAALTTSNYIEVTANPECNLTGLNPDKDYYFYVRAVCGDDEVSHWNCCHYTTSLTCSAPVSPTATSGADNSVTFTVNPGEVGTVGTYDYRYWISGSNDTVTESGKPSSFTVGGLSGDKEYEWEVRANCSGTGEGSSRWVKGNTINVCGTMTLPYFNDFERYDKNSVPECWTVTQSYWDDDLKLAYPLISFFNNNVIDLEGNSAIATPPINVPAEGLRISLELGIDAPNAPNAKMKVMFTTDLTTFTDIATLGCSSNGAENKVVTFVPGAATRGYIVFQSINLGARDICALDNLLIEAMPTSDTKDVTVDNVRYTISGLLQGNNVTIEEVSFNEDDLTEADFDITYNNTFLNYKHKLDVPTTLTDVIKDRYKVVAIKADAFEDVDITLNETVRVNIPAAVNVEDDVPECEMVVIKRDGDGILYNGNSYPASMAYKVNLCDGATLEQRPFGDNRPLQITYTNGDNITETEIIVNTHVYKTEGEMQFKYEEGEWSEQSSESGTFEAMLNEDEATIDVGRSNTIRVDTNARYNGTFDLTFCNELKFQTDNVNRRYPDCQFTANMPLGDDTKVKAEMKFNNKEYYYFSLPFDCKLEDIKVMAETSEISRSATIQAAIQAAINEPDAHHYVLFKWNESAYTSDETTGYVAFSGTMLEKNKGYVIAIVESDDWYVNHADDPLDVTATFTANDDYAEIASSESEVEIPVTRADAANAFSGWNLVGNPFYGSVMSSQYSFNKYVRKVVSDNGEKPDVKDYASEIPVFNAPIRPFETVFIQKSDAAGEGTVTVTGSPVQKVQGAPAMLPEYVTITLNDSSRMIDRTTIINDVLSSDDFLQEEDLLKSHQGSNEIYTQYGDFDFSFNEMDITDADKTIPLAVKVAAEGDYTIAMSSELSNYPAGYVFLHDKTLETYMKVSDGEVETLHLTEGVTEDRLELIIKVEEVIVEPDNTEDVSEGGIAVYVHHGIATIEGIEVGAMVTIVDATGKTLYMSEATGNRMDYQFTVRGVYMITVRNNANVNTVKVVY